MKYPLAVFTGLLLSAVSAMPTETVSFDATPVGSLPANWLGTMTGSGSPHWSVEKDASAPSQSNVLKQSGEATYPLCLKTDTKLKDGFVEARFMPVSGQEDQAGGLVWRAKDANNYYIARANALEDNVHIYHTVDGRRGQFDGVDAKVKGGQWHTLRVEFAGPVFTVLLNGKKVLTATDRTFTDAGMVGVWTKADSVTLFDNFSYGGTYGDKVKGDIVFVCEHGNVKSLMAASYFNDLARERNLPYRAVSRGSAPDTKAVPAVIAQGLRGDGFDITGFLPTAIDDEELSTASRVILISTELPSSVHAPAVDPEHWNDVPPATIDFGAARSALKAHILALVDRLSSAHAGTSDSVP